jgi:hypothetical protein
MLEIEKQQRRFQDKPLKELIDDYERNFVRPQKDATPPPPPNSPYPEEQTRDLPLKEKKKEKKSG